MKTRRKFIKKSMVAGSAISLYGFPVAASPRIHRPEHQPLETLRVGFVGIGVKGSQHLGILMNMDGVE